MRFLRTSLPGVDSLLQAARDNAAYLLKIKRSLSLKKIMSPAVEAQILIFHFSKINRIDFLTGTKIPSLPQKKKIEQALQKRLTGIPAAYLTETAGFYGHDFLVNPSVLIPRPETELLVEQTLKILNQVPQGSDPSGTKAAKSLFSPRGQRGQTPLAPEVLEIGTGSGCIAVSLTIARPDCRMTALDISSEALKTARRNARQHGVAGRISFVKSDLFSVFGPRHRGRWDILVSNPPYVPRSDFRNLQREVKKEPRLALDGGKSGLVVIEKILREAPYYLKNGGYILLEIGKGQSRALGKMATQMKFFQSLKFVKDYAGIDRFLVARKIG